MLELHLDPVGGIAGDMFAAALLDLRPDLETGLRQALALCPLIEDVDIELVAHHDGILTGRRFLVTRPGDPKRQPHDHGHHHHHTDWRLIRDALVASRLDRATVNHAIGIFALLAEAEGKVHGVAPDDVSFHEVGAWDSIADIVAAGWLISQIGATRWTAGALPLGGGQVNTAHGLLPVPAPATVLLLQGFTTIDDGVSGERVTPTGAAILRYLCDGKPTPARPRVLTASSHGFGTRRLPGLSNCLRILVFEAAEPSFATCDQVAVLECEIDDQTGEDLAQAIEQLRRLDGVLDVIQAPVFGKKGRMMTHLRILAEPIARDDILHAVFTETTTIGIRHWLVERSVLSREATTTDYDGRTLRVKIADRPLGRTAKLEADELSHIPRHDRREALRRAVDEAFTGRREER